MPHKLRQRHPSLPSPPSSETLRQKDKPRSTHSESAVSTQTRKQTRPCDSPYIEPRPEKKRRRATDEQVSDHAQQPYRKRYKKELDTQQQQPQQPQQVSFCEAEGVEQQDPILCWANTKQWPKSFGQMDGSESNGLNKRRRSSTPSYSSRARDGSVPRAHTAAYEQELGRYGIMFNDPDTQDWVTTESKEMCQGLLDLNDPAPFYNSCSVEVYMKLFQRASKCNEERVRRDLTPHIVPSAELLYLLDQETDLENVREEMSADWTKVNLLGGTQPRPDYAYGMSSATFTEEEHVKMQAYTSFNNPTKFTDSMYFPFFLCEAKCGSKNINDADRQNVHSASIAVNAIVQLSQAAGEDIATLSGQVLVFSISHDNERVKIYGHFPIVRDNRTTFHRYYIEDYSLDGHYGRNRHIGSNFSRALYRKFYPLHLQRIRQAIARLPDPRTTSMATDLSISESEMQGSEQSSQEAGTAARPPLRRAKSRGSQGELTLMKQQMAKIEQMYKTQLEQQKEDNQKQMEQQQKQMEQQQKQMEQQKEDSRKQMEQQKEDSRKQMEQQQKQMEQQQKQMDLLERLLNQRQT